MLIEKIFYAETEAEKDEIVSRLEKEYGIPQYMANIKDYKLNNGTYKIELSYSSLD